MAKPTKGVLIINLGTPDSPAVKDVRKYLREFLMDRRVIDINPIGRWMLVNLIIAPFRSPKSAKTYKELWTKDGSPLLYHGVELKRLLQNSLGDDYRVVFGMRYQSPSIKSALMELENNGIKEIIVLPLYPQYASATTGSTVEQVMDDIKSWEIIPDLKFINHYTNHPAFIDAFVARGEEYLKEEYDYILFSYHGLPERQIKKGSCNDYCQLSDKCCSKYHSLNEFCYRAQCFETTRQLAAKLKLKEGDYTTCFQSRLGRAEWIKPYTEDTIRKLAKEGKKKILVFAPAFVADCLETTIEIGDEYRELFEELGGEKLQLVESLNVHPKWVEGLKELVEEFEN